MKIMDEETINKVDEYLKLVRPTRALSGKEKDILAQWIIETCTNATLLEMCMEGNLQLDIIDGEIVFMLDGNPLTLH